MACSTRFREAEAFVFHTRLVHISDALRERDAGARVDRLSLMVAGRRRRHARSATASPTSTAGTRARVIHSRTCVMIVSDGYDTGPPERLAAEMSGCDAAAAASSGSTR